MSRIPLLLLTGFLGSGKTSLLNRLVRQAAFRDTAVVINEAGIVGLDHLLIERGADGIVLLEGGCLCCTSQGGLAPALAALLRRRRADGTLPFTRVVVETSGLADPGPILQSLIGDIVFNRHFGLAGVTTLVDGRAFEATLARHPEALMQVAFADRLVITKADLITPDDLDRIGRTLAGINDVAPQIVAWGDGSAAEIWTDAFDLARFVSADARRCPDSAPAIVTASRRFPGALPSQDLDGWLEHTLALFGPALLRLKGIVNVVGRDRPVVVHAVGGLLHGFDVGLRPPERDNRMVLIGRDTDGAMLVDALTQLAALAASP